MRSRADTDTIGVSCSHRVPRQPIERDGRRLYWCEDCQAYRMSGGHTTGEIGMDGFLALADATAGLTVRFPRPLPEHAAQLMAALGVQTVIDPTAPSSCCINPNYQHGPDPRRHTQPTRDSSTRGGGTLPTRKEKRS